MPLFRIGQRVEDERRGLIRIVGVSDGRIPWPIGYGPGGKSLVLYRGLSKAVRRDGVNRPQVASGAKGAALERRRLAA